MPLDMEHNKDRDFPEDFSHENGMYMCRCCHCKNIFIGYKRRVTCKLCEETEKDRQANLTEEERLLESEQAHRLIQQFFLDIQTTRQEIKKKARKKS